MSDTFTANIEEPTAQMSCETTEGVHSKEIILEQVNDIEPLEQLDHIEPNIIENAHQELGTPLPSILSEQLQPLSENVSNDSIPHLLEHQHKHMGSNLSQNETGENNSNVPNIISENRTLICDSEGVIRNCQTDKISCPQQSMSGQNKECVLGDLSASTISRSPISKQPEQPSDDVVESSHLEQFETSSKSLRNSSKLGRKVKRTSKSRPKKYMLRSLASSDRLLRSRTQEKPKCLEPSNDPVNANVGNGVEKKRKEKKKKGVKRVIADEFSGIKKRLRYFLNRIQYEQSLIDAYSSEGWKGNSLEKLKPEKELQRATSEISRRKLKIRDLFQQLDELCAEGGFPEALFDSEGQIDSEDIFCAKCGSKDLSAGNDIILCDGACDRGFHQFCLEPPLLNEDIPPDDEGWLCPGCDCKVDCVDLLNDSLETNLSVDDSWEKVFPEAAAAARGGNNLDHNPELPSDDSEDDDYDPDGLDIDEKIDRDESSSDESSSDESSSDESEYASACDELEAPPNNELSLKLSSDDDSEDNDYDPNAVDTDENVKQESSSSHTTSDSEDLTPTDDDNKAKRLSGKSGKQSCSSGGKKSSLKGELLDILKSGPGEDGSPPISEKRHVERLDYKKLHDEAYGNVPSESSDDEDWSDSAATRKRKKKTTEQGAPMLSSDDKEWNDSSTRKRKKKATEQVAPQLPNGNASVEKSEATGGKRKKKATGQVAPQLPNGNASIEKSEATGGKGKKKATGQVAPQLPNGNASIEKSEATGDAINHNLENHEHISRRRSRGKSMVKDTNDSPSKLKKTMAKDTNDSPSKSKKPMAKDTYDSPSKSPIGSPKSASTGSRLKSASYKRLGDAATQGLYTSFKENQYPDRAKKQSLAEELGLTPRQVSKWFENMRWSVRHPLGREADKSGSASKRSISSPQPDKQLLESKQDIGASNGELPVIVVALPETCTKNEGDDKAKLLTNESNSQTSAARTSGRKRSRPKIEKPTTPVVVDTNKTSGSRTRSRRKSAP
ncbi:hypothetical protein F8388_006939 [Cannabis sativa]|uniref:Uncharacterized protein n=1 Tax=Cannabis sativa TaxID=3483 RepID=A0A7J6GHI5_CANSA|nr:hypothetical protein F8388_006939 [Cannabis sativa]KAF4382363.1 hypothetical protein G4B88_011315 [Cannabis sativa]